MTRQPWNSTKISQGAQWPRGRLRTWKGWLLVELSRVHETTCTFRSDSAMACWTLGSVASNSAKISKSIGCNKTGLFRHIFITVAGLLETVSTTSPGIGQNQEKSDGPAKQVDTGDSQTRATLPFLDQSFSGLFADLGSSGPNAWGLQTRPEENYTSHLWSPTSHCLSRCLRRRPRCHLGHQQVQGQLN